MRQRAIVVAVTTLMFAGVSTVLAQMRWGSPAMPRTGVCVYEDANYRGRYFCASAGQTFATLPADFRDRISSIRIVGRAQITVFREDRFRGPAARFLTDVRNLKNEGWNDAIMSFRVENEGLGWTRRGLEWGNPRPPAEGACFYEDPDYRGRYFCLPRGASDPQVPVGFNDKISSIRLFRSSIIVFVDRDFGGRGQRITSDVPRLRGFWDDRISSIRVF
jgi:hypothetical protein